MAHTHNHQAECLAEAHALELGSELIRVGGIPHLARCEVEAGGWRIVVEVHAASELPDLTPCEADLVTLLRGRRTRTTTTQLLGELDRAGFLHGESTVKLALARLVRGRILTSSRLAPRGYLLCDRYQVQPAADVG